MLISELSANMALPPVAPVAVALLTKTRKRNVEGALCGARFAINIIVSQNGTIKVVSRPRNNQG